jgi:DNA ligase D-like protein (predicted 3'-phosphoesterase)
MTDPARRPPERRSSCTLTGSDSAAHPERTPVFVLQKRASHLRRWRLRVEVGERLRSWIVPRGVGREPDERRIALPTADEPILSREPGADPLEDDEEVWDSGPYTNLRVGVDGRPVPLEEQLRAGHAVLWLHGDRIQGGYALIRAEAGRDGRWLLVKLDDDDETGSPRF